MADEIGKLESRPITRNGQPAIAKRGKASAKFRQPPPVVDIDLGWGRYQPITMEEAITMHAQLDAIIREYKGS